MDSVDARQRRNECSGALAPVDQRWQPSQPARCTCRLAPAPWCVMLQLPVRAVPPLLARNSERAVFSAWSPGSAAGWPRRHAPLAWMPPSAARSLICSAPTPPFGVPWLPPPPDLTCSDLCVLLLRRTAGRPCVGCRPAAACDRSSLRSGPRHRHACPPPGSRRQLCPERRPQQRPPPCRR